MMKLARLHAWPRTATAGVQLQHRLAMRVVLQPVTGRTRLMAGADAAFCDNGASALGGVVVGDRLTQTVVEQSTARVACRFPYIPGLLTFRELPALLAAFRKLRMTPEVVFADAHGLAHPRRMGLACMLGLWLNVPTVGCAKSLLCGEHGTLGRRRGSAVPLVHKGEQVGAVLRTQSGVKPVYVSPGHLCDCESACRLTLTATSKYRVPDPIRQAHQLVTRTKALLVERPRHTIS